MSKASAANAAAATSCSRRTSPGTITATGDVREDRSNRADYLPQTTVGEALTVDQQLDALASRAQLSYQHRADRKSRWKTGNYVFGATAALLAFAASARSLTEWFGRNGEVMAGGLAFASGLVAVFVSSFDLSRRFAESAAQKAGSFALATDASWLQTEWNGRQPGARAKRVRELLDRELGLRTSDVEYSGAAATPRRAPIQDGA